MGSLIQPPPTSFLQQLGIAPWQWLQDTWKKLTTIQTQTNSAFYISGLVVQNNTPVGGQISWSACTVYYNGTAYPIAAGSSGTDKLVWWNVGDTVFSHGTTYTPSTTTFGILTNNAGTADFVWFKIGANSVQASQVVGNLLPPGYQIQPPANLTITGAGTTTLLSYTGSGGLISLGFNLGTLGSFTNISFTVNVDGQGAQTYPVYTGGVFDKAWLGTTFAGQSPSTIQVAPFNVSFKTSIVVQVVVTGVGITGSATATAAYAQLIPSP